MLREILSRTVIGLALVLAAGPLTRVEAADKPIIFDDGPRWPNVPDTVAPPLETFVKGEFGLRYWYSRPKASKDLYGIAGGSLVSRLTYEGMSGHSVEGYGRADHSSGLFLKGYVGGGILGNGRLIDEDFEPVTIPYSSTVSEQRDGNIGYASIDAGYNLWRHAQGRLGIFAGYHHLYERLNAFGCVQMAGNPDICPGDGVPMSVKAIVQDNRWQSVRVGLDADLKLSRNLTLHADAAWLPYVHLKGEDWHRLRIGTQPGDFVGGIPEDGSGTGYQFELALSYAVSDWARIGIGGRYWRMETKGHAHFEGNVVAMNAVPQPLDWKTESFGVFVQGSFKFGPYSSRYFR